MSFPNTFYDAPRDGAPEWLSGGRIPSLDGLRALAAVLVTVFHFLAAPGCPIPYPEWLANWHGTRVDLLFVVSGFLVTHLLLREAERGRGISLQGFFFRRAVRIYPAYVLMLAVALAMSLGGLINLDSWVLTAAATYTLNLVPGSGGQAVSHAWSLCVLEHFYLVWPVVLALAGRRWAGVGLGATIVGAAALRLFLTADARLDIDYFTLTRADTVAVGCLLAYAFRWPLVWRLGERVRGRGDRIVAAAALGLVLSLSLLGQSGKYALGPMPFVNAACLAVIVFAVICDPGCWMGRALNSRPAVAVGAMSYSLYLAQLFTWPTFSPTWPLSWWWALPLVAAYTLASYLLVERPCLRLKEWCRTASGDRTGELFRRTVGVFPILEGVPVMPQSLREVRPLSVAGGAPAS